MLTGAVLGGLFFGMDVGIWNASLDYTPAANATFMTNTAPLWVGLFSLFVLKEKLPRLFWPGMVLALGGAALMVFSNGGNVAVRQGDLKAVRHGQSPWELYDLKADPVELSNLADQQPEKTQELVQLWERWIGECKQQP